MISNQILQNTIDGLKSITRVELHVLDADGKVLASTEEEHYTDQYLAVTDFVQSQAESQMVMGHHFFKVYDDHKVEYVISAKGEAEDIYKIGKIAAFQIQNLLVAYKERYDKDNFIKNLLLDNLLLVDIYTRAKKLHIDMDVRRVAIIIETKMEKDLNALEVVKSIYPSKGKEFITAVDERNIILVKELSEKDNNQQIEKICAAILDTLNAEAMSSCYLAYGTVVSDLKDVSRSYKEAKMALEVGRIFYPDHQIMGYNTLGIGRLIYQLPVPLCKMFITEIFQNRTPDEFDDETLSTINKFFDNNLNVSETSRQLYIHRNTLVYRLDKIQKLTGLDLRVFDDAITFKIALMVVKYMKYMSEAEY